MAKHGFRVMERWEELSTDWPHDDSRFPHSIDSFLALPYLSSETKRKVLWDNCARLYNLQPVSVESPGGN